MYTRSQDSRDRQDNYKDSASFDYEARIIRLSPSQRNYPANQATDKKTRTTTTRREEKNKIKIVNYCLVMGRGTTPTLFE